MLPEVAYLFIELMTNQIVGKICFSKEKTKNDSSELLKTCLKIGFEKKTQTMGKTLPLIAEGRAYDTNKK